MYVEPRKMVQMNRFAGQRLRHRCREQTYGHQLGKATVGGWGWCCDKKKKRVMYRTPMSIAALFTIARTWKQPKCPSTDEWIKKMWHIYTMEYYSARERNETELFVVSWMDLEPVTQSEVSQKDKNKYRMLMHIYGK